MTPARQSGPAKKAATKNAPAAPVIEATMLALRPRPEPAPEALAAITAAAQLVWPRPGAASQPEARPSESWRFSGRWWAQPALVRRARPWTGR